MKRFCCGVRLSVIPSIYVAWILAMLHARVHYERDVEQMQRYSIYWKKKTKTGFLVNV